ncbi:MAG TPA: cytochrome c biogenesis protein CcsA [Saprospiraceae bacterium]|nr:cytochrome c biogenesis protein CcsA [Saprospiraceae bacterium]
MIYKSWWKILGVLLLVYAFTVGMMVPLKPGILSVTPASLRTGQSAQVKVLGYNSHYAKAGDSLRAWLKLDEEKALAASSIEVLNDRELLASFQIPEYLPVSRRVQDFTVVVDNEIDGYSLRPSAVVVTQDSLDPSMGQQLWVNRPIEELHSKKGMTFPFRNILEEGIRNTYFHVALWFAMLFLYIGSLVFSIRFLRKQDLDLDRRAAATTQIGTLLGILGLITGAIWAKYTWGAFWSWDVKQNMTAIALLIYLAYFILRSSFEDPEKRARIAAVYNIFAFVALIPLIYVIPRLTDSLHPGAGGNPALGGEDLDNTMRMVFYPAIIGWTLLGYWMASLSYRTERLRQRVLEED